MKPNVHQQAVIERLMQKHHELMEKRRFGMIELRKQLDADLATLRREESLIANEAMKTGVSKTRIGRAMGTSNWDSVNEVLNLTAMERKVEQEIADSLPRFAVSSPRRGDIQIQVFTEDDGKLISPPRFFQAARRQGTQWGDESYYYFTYRDLGVRDVDTLDAIEAEMITQIRLKGGNEMARIEGRPEVMRSTTVPTTTVGSAWGATVEDAPMPGTPEYEKWIDED